MSRLFFVSLLLLAVPAAASAQDRPAPPTVKTVGPKIVFLGDSNTFAGLWIAYCDGYLRTRFPERRYELINLGLPSETVSGLSEADHPYPRPDVRERLDRALAQTRPDTVVLCYGMNDGIYAPFDEGRFAKYCDGIDDVVRRCEKAGANVVLMTPAPFDPLPLAKVVQPASAAKFSWLRPYAKYDDVLTRYSDWLLAWRKKGYVVADAHGRIRDFLKTVRATEPGYFLASDGIHPNPTGHALIALELLHALHATAATTAPVACDRDTLRLAWNAPLPMPLDARWDARLVTVPGDGGLLQRPRLQVRGLPAGDYELLEGETVLGVVSAAMLERGIDTALFAALSTNRRSAQLGMLAQKRERLVGLAWLTAVGYKRPDTPQGRPLAEVRPEADRLDRALRELARPRELALRLRKK